MYRGHAITTGCVLTITAVTLTAAPAAALRATAVPTAAMPRTTKIPAVPSARKPPPGMVEALQRDLGLTKEQARVRLLNEARLTAVASQLRWRLGDRFGGSWLKGDTANTLVVATTSAADIPEVLAAGAQPEVVSRSLAELIPIKKKLDETFPAHPRASSVHYIDVKTNKVVVLSATSSETENIIKSIGIDTTAVAVVPSTEQPRSLFDLRGGDAYYIGTASRCSIGFSVVSATQKGFISAGHCGHVGDTTSGANRVDQGVFQGSTFPTSDFSFIAVNAGWTPRPLVSNGGAGADGTVPVNGAKVAIEGASVCRSGSTTDWHCGTVLQRDASVTYPQGNVFGLTRTNVCAEPGDSGGPFISIDQAQGVTSGGSGDCTLGGITYFQPIGEILTAYGLSLVTTQGASPPPTTNTCTGYPKTVTGTLNPGRAVYQPNNLYYRATVAGLHTGCLDGPTGTDFDLYLQKWNGVSWPTVATSNGSGPDEKISYTGTPGYYRYRLVAAGGSGPYTLGYRTL